MNVTYKTQDGRTVTVPIGVWEVGGAVNKTLKIIKDFKRGLSPIGLARKYGLTVKRIEQIIRSYLGAL